MNLAENQPARVSKFHVVLTAVIREAFKKKLAVRWLLGLNLEIRGPSLKAFTELDILLDAIEFKIETTWKASPTGPSREYIFIINFEPKG